MSETTTLRCPTCGGEAYLCDRPHHGTATWAFHCRASLRHNEFGADGDGGPPTEWIATRHAETLSGRVIWP